MCAHGNMLLACRRNEGSIVRRWTTAGVSNKPQRDRRKGRILEGESVSTNNLPAKLLLASGIYVYLCLVLSTFTSISGKKIM